MVNQSIKEFAKAIKKGNSEKAEEFIEKILKEKEKALKSKKIEELAEIRSNEAEKLQDHGFKSLEALAKAKVKKLTEIPEIGENIAEKIIKSAQKEVDEEFSELPGVGPDKAAKIREYGYYSIDTLADADKKELAEIPKIGEKIAENIIKFAKERRVEEKEIEGYRHALEGVLTALESDRVLTLPNKISAEKYSKEKLEEIRKEMKSRALHDFRPAEEKGFNEAWADILEALT
ncbi:hypothetical protein AKJ49_02140 [candidate division MSBL1 archaeon SCGC-AAA382A03]|uniref:Helix-hairpin-helix DNA-binding motif class 1 domain-containing protein n=1 Tax=candidate division MSBL1 archaeon SCGC-AAA382A03 TaxID=1698278 RepID=A0A133VD66_9EURY|nr:hypothetical protein AKJ49_02140 [candidate division MSBL1 archaeon SCGC-AAA382A03]